MPVSRPLAHSNGGLVASAGVLLSGLGASFVWYVASEEPFIFMSTATLITLEALGLGLLVLFGTWGFKAVSVARGLRHHKLRVPMALLTGLWTLAGCFYLGITVVSCWDDYRRFRHGVPGTLGHVAVEGNPTGSHLTDMLLSR